MRIRIITDESELPRGSYYALPVPVEPGQLALIELGGKLDVVGRWYPDLNGYDWVVAPKRVIRISGNTPRRVVGLIIPSEDPPAQITNLPADEYEKFFDNPFPKALN